MAALILADGLLALPIWFLGIMGAVKYSRWRKDKVRTIEAS